MSTVTHEEYAQRFADKRPEIRAVAYEIEATEYFERSRHMADPEEQLGVRSLAAFGLQLAWEAALDGIQPSCGKRACEQHRLNDRLEQRMERLSNLHEEWFGRRL